MNLHLDSPQYTNFGRDIVFSANLCYNKDRIARNSGIGLVGCLCNTKPKPSMRKQQTRIEPFLKVNLRFSKLYLPSVYFFSAMCYTDCAESKRRKNKWQINQWER